LERIFKREEFGDLKNQETGAFRQCIVKNQPLDMLALKILDAYAT